MLLPVLTLRVFAAFIEDQPDTPYLRDNGLTLRVFAAWSLTWG